MITAPATNETVTGVIGVTAQVNAQLDAAGSYLMIDGVEVGTRRVSASPYVYPLDTTQVADGQHTLQLWAHDTGNNTVLSSPVVVTISNAGSAPVPTPPAPPVTPPTPTPTPDPVLTATYPITLTYPISGQALSGTVAVSATISQTLDAAGSYLMVDGLEVGTRRIGSAPYVYDLDTTTLSAGLHVLQVFAHDTGNNNLLSNQATVVVAAP